MARRPSKHQTQWQRQIQNTGDARNLKENRKERRKQRNKKESDGKAENKGKEIRRNEFVDNKMKCNVVKAEKRTKQDVCDLYAGLKVADFRYTDAGTVIWARKGA